MTGITAGQKYEKTTSFAEFGGDLLINVMVTTKSAFRLEVA